MLPKFRQKQRFTALPAAARLDLGMRFIEFVAAGLLVGGMALGGPLDDPTKPATSPKTTTASPSPAVNPAPHAIPPVLRSSEPDDTTFVVLPGAPRRAVAEPPKTAEPKPPEPETSPPIPRRSDPPYPPEFGTESAIFCQHLIGEWTQEDAIALLGDPKSRRPALGDDGAPDGDIFAFSDPSSRYREIELDFDHETGALRTVFAYPWKLTWKDCRKFWGDRFSADDAEKGRVFYSYEDRRLDVLVDPVGNVISLGFY